MAPTKGENTKRHILEVALDLASVHGLGQVSIGDIAEKAKLSRSGMFAHFASKENLQLDILRFAEENFIAETIAPVHGVEDPLKKIEHLKKHWPGWEERIPIPLQGGCLFLAAIFEFDDQPGAVRDYLIVQQQRMIKYIRSCAEEACTKKFFARSLDTGTFAYEFYSYYMGYHYFKKFFGSTKAKPQFNAAIDALVERSRA